VQRQAVLTELAKAHVPGESTETGFRVLGYAELGVEVDYLALGITAKCGPSRRSLNSRITVEVSIMDCEDLRQRFLNRKRVEGVEYQHNDYVRVTDGEYKGRSGSLISLEAIAPEPLFLVELEDGGDIEVRQSQLILVGHD
jgi:hypothetical protein